MSRNILSNALGDKLRSGQHALGSWVWFTDPSSAEVMARAGFDWLMIDVEHSYIGAETLRNLIIAIEGQGCVPMVRVKVKDIDSIKLALDCGAGGVVVPQVNTREEAAWVVSHSKYAPLGKRGIGALRASRYGLEWNEYLREANRHVLTIAQIEDMEGVRNLAEILSTPGLDGIYIGPADLAQSLGILPGENADELSRVIDSIIKTANTARLPVGIFCMTLDEVRQMVERGVTFPTVGSDLDFLAASARSSVAGWKR